ncbi:hypothetical protein [Priestia megaterium]
MDKVKLNYESLDFSELKSTFYKTNDLSFSWNQLLWAAITVGRKNWGDIKVDNCKKEILFGKSMLEFALSVLPKSEQDEYGMDEIKFRPYTSEGFNLMDSSEKSAISYFISTIFVKLFASKLLNCPWLMHLDRYRGSLNPTFFKYGKNYEKTKRPDLVGIRRGPMLKDDIGNPYIDSRWMAFESKGRSTRDRGALKTAKGQLSNLNQINSDDPLRIAFELYSSSKNEVKVLWQDPEGENNKDSYSLYIDEDHFLYEYYNPIYQLIRSSTNEIIEFNHKPYVICEIDRNLKIGLRLDFFEFISLRLIELINEQQDENQNEDYVAFYEKELGLYNWTEGADGILVGTRKLVNRDSFFS